MSVFLRDEPEWTIERIKDAIKRSILTCGEDLELWYIDGLCELICLERDLLRVERKQEKQAA